MEEHNDEHDRLVQAIKDGNNEIVKHMVQTIKNQGGLQQDFHDACCFLAIEKGCINILKLIFDKNELDIDITVTGVEEYKNFVYMSRVLDKESVEGVDFLLSEGLKLLTFNSYPWSAFIYCVEHDKKDILKYIITLPQLQYPKYQLSFAAMTKNPSFLKKCLEYPELLSVINECYAIFKNTYPPNYWRFHEGNARREAQQELDCIKLLIEAGADIKFFPMAITLAAYSQNIEAILSLLDQGVGLDDHNLTETLVKVCGMRDGDVDLILKCIQRLIEAGADPHLPNDSGQTPLSASIGKRREVFDYILNLNLDKRYIDVRCESLKIPILNLVIMSYSNDVELMEKILTTGCDVNLCDFESNTPLMHASARLSLNLVKRLLDYGADVNACNNEGKNAGNFCLEFDDVDESYDDGNSFDNCLNNVIDIFTSEETKRSNRKLSVLKLLIDRGMTINNEYNLLLSAFDIVDLQCINFLLETDIEKDHIGCMDQNILHLATETQLTWHDYLMFSKKVKNINQKDKAGHTPLSKALNFNITMNNNLIQLLLDSGCDVNTRDNDGASALMKAVRRGEVGFTRALLKAGAKPGELLKDRIIWLGIDDCLTLVLQNGGDVLLNTPDERGNYIIARALKDCMYEGDEWIVNNILTYNPSLHNLSLTGKDPLHIFTDADYFDILDLLYQSGAPKSELVKNSSDDVVELIDQRIGDYTLMSRCRRIIRQTIGLGIKEKVKKLSLPEPLRDFILLRDLIHECYFELE